MEDIEFDHPSLDASLRDFDPGSSELGQSPQLGLYPLHHSGFCSDEDSEVAESSVGRGGYSPPAWRRTRDGHRSSGFWEKGVQAEGDLRESSPEYESADEGDATLAKAARTRLPTGSLSPEKHDSPAPYTTSGGPSDEMIDGLIKEESEKPATEGTLPLSPINSHSCKLLFVYLVQFIFSVLTVKDIRFAMRAEVRHRTEPFDAIVSYAKSKLDSITKSWSSIISTSTGILLAALLFTIMLQPGVPLPVPDLVKVAGLARAFEPLIFYSENGVQQINDLQATGVAVWDLGESVRSTNMTSAPIIVKELDDLSESLKTLSIELTKFFANVDGDVDG